MRGQHLAVGLADARGRRGRHDRQVHGRRGDGLLECAHRAKGSRGRRFARPFARIEAASEPPTPRWPRRGCPEVSVGIGLNTGPASVGLMGSKDRLSYTCNRRQRDAGRAAGGADADLRNRQIAVGDATRRPHCPRVCARCAGPGRGQGVRTGGTGSPRAPEGTEGLESSDRHAGRGPRGLSSHRNWTKPRTG